MSSDVVPFSPVLPTVTRTVNTGSQGIALGTVARTASPAAGSSSNAPTFAGGFSVRCVNEGSVTIYVEFGYGSAATAAVATSFPMLANTSEIFTVGEGCTHISAISSTSTANLYATPGQGI